MDDSVRIRVFELKQRGYCCSQIILQMGLEAQKKENSDLIKAASGLCNGLQHDLECGILTGGVCLLALWKPLNADMSIVNELVEWFRDMYDAAYGGINCTDILGGDLANRTVRCPEVLVATYKKARDLMDDYDYEVAPDA